MPAAWWPALPRCGRMSGREMQMNTQPTNQWLEPKPYKMSKGAAPCPSEPAWVAASSSRLGGAM